MHSHYLPQRTLPAWNSPLYSHFRYFKPLALCHPQPGSTQSGLNLQWSSKWWENAHLTSQIFDQNHPLSIPQNWHLYLGAFKTSKLTSPTHPPSIKLAALLYLKVLPTTHTLSSTSRKEHMLELALKLRLMRKCTLYLTNRQPESSHPLLPKIDTLPSTQIHSLIHTHTHTLTVPSTSSFPHLHFLSSLSFVDISLSLSRRRPYLTLFFSYHPKLCSSKHLAIIVA